MSIKKFLNQKSILSVLFLVVVVMCQIKFKGTNIAYCLPLFILCLYKVTMADTKAKKVAFLFMGITAISCMDVVLDWLYKTILCVFSYFIATNLDLLAFVKKENVHEHAHVHESESDTKKPDTDEKDEETEV